MKINRYQFSSSNNGKQVKNTKPGFLLNFFSKVFIKYFTVERGNGKRKYIWTTKAFRDMTYLHLPKLFFIFGFSFFIYKQQLLVKKNSSKEYLQESQVYSDREENINKHNKVKLTPFIQGNEKGTEFQE